MHTLQALYWATCFTIARTTLFTTAAPICLICVWWRRTTFTTTTPTITLTTASHQNCTIFCSERITTLSAYPTWLLQLSSKIDSKVCTYLRSYCMISLWTRYCLPHRFCCINKPLPFWKPDPLVSWKIGIFRFITVPKYNQNRNVQSFAKTHTSAINFK